MLALGLVLVVLPFFQLVQTFHLHRWQLALVVLFHSATSTDSPLAHMVVSPSATCAGGAFHPATGANTVLAPGQLALCGGGSM